jgi:diguanylate cyclase (GGDEF)-like protein
MELKFYVQMLQRGWKLIAFSALTGLGTALLLTYLSTPVYLSTARFVVSPSSASISQGTSVIDSLNVLDKRSIVTTYAQVLNSDSIFQRTLADLLISPESVAGYSSSSVVLPDTNVLEIYVQGTDPQIVALLANSIGIEAIHYIDGLNQGYNIRVLDIAQVPTEPIRPQPSRDASLGLAFGLIFGFALAFIREQLLAPIDAFLQRHNLDPDSDVFNRRYFDRKLDETLARSALVGFHTLGLVYLEGFVGYIGNIPKPIEQQVMRKVAKILSNELRGNDLVGRWDDATFAVLLPGTPGRAAEITLGRIQSMLSEPFAFGEAETIYLKPRVGLAEPLGDESSNALREHAEIALKQAVDGDLNLVVFKMEDTASL